MKREQRGGERCGAGSNTPSEEVNTMLLKEKFDSMGENKLNAYLAKKRKRKEQKAKVAKPFKRRHVD